LGARTKIWSSKKESIQMTEPITISYTPNAKDYSSTLRVFAYDRKRIWSTVVISMIALVVAERALYARDLGNSIVPPVL
jgi:hypothetical protein